MIDLSRGSFTNLIYKSWLLCYLSPTVWVPVACVQTPSTHFFPILKIDWDEFLMYILQHPLMISIPQWCSTLYHFNFICHSWVVGCWLPPPLWFVKAFLLSSYSILKYIWSLGCWQLVFISNTIDYFIQCSREWYLFHCRTKWILQCLHKHMIFHSLDSLLFLL